MLLLLLRQLNMSTAWYRSNVIPSVVRQWKNPQSNRLLSAVEVWDTTCIVTNFQGDVLINPSNPRLSGVSDFPYFPKGGPQPKTKPAKDAHHIMGYVTQWGGMEVGQGMMFPANVVDGLVHQLGGVNLKKELATIGECPEGEAVLTTQSDSLPYASVVHTVPPFYGLSNNDLLANCYYNSLQLIHKRILQNQIRVACPLLGAGCRGFPPEEAIQRAARALLQCTQMEIGATKHLTLAFAIPSGELRKMLVETIDLYWNDKGSHEEESLE